MTGKNTECIFFQDCLGATRRRSCQMHCLYQVLIIVRIPNGSWIKIVIHCIALTASILFLTSDVLSYNICFISLKDQVCVCLWWSFVIRFSVSKDPKNVCGDAWRCNTVFWERKVKKTFFGKGLMSSRLSFFALSSCRSVLWSVEPWRNAWSFVLHFHFKHWGDWPAATRVDNTQDYMHTAHTPTHTPTHRTIWAAGMS